MSNQHIITNYLSKHPVFEGLTENELNGIASNPICKTEILKSGEEIKLPSSLVLILKGQIEVYRKGVGAPVLLQRLGCGKVFGAASLFSKDEKPTTLLCDGACEIFVISSDVISDLISKKPDFALCYIKFLSSKIRFLNQRLNEIASPSVSSKLASFLINSQSSGIALSKVQLASALGIGRASLYRVLDSFCKQGLITYKGKNVVITDKDSLKKLI